MSHHSTIEKLVVVLVLACPLASADALRPSSQTPAFQTDMARAMTTMDAGMMNKPTGDVDKDFVAMMVPHHQGAIDMAMAELRYGHNEQLRRIAQEIIVDQQQEIAAMHLALAQRLPPSTPSPTQPDRPIPDHSGVHAGQEH
jgi:hypothetical protein